MESMRKLSQLLVAAVVAVGLATSANASVLTLVGSMGIGIGALPPVTFPNNASPTVTVSSGNGSFTEPAGLFTGSVMLPTALFTGVALINGLTIGNFANGTKTINTAGAIAGPRTVDVIRPGNGALGGEGPLLGTAFVNVLGLFNLAVPLSAIGSNGASTYVIAGTLAVTAVATGWTTGTVMLTGVTTATPGGNNINTVTFQGYDNRTPGHNGVIQVISPFKVITNAAGNLPGIALQTLTFFGAVPEPGTLLLIGSGVAGLAILGRKRLRK
jgi:hypothetical protein